MPLEHEVINYKDQSHWLQLRSEDITSSDISAMFGFSPYATLFETWHSKSGGFRTEFQGTERTAWGNRLEDGIALGAAEEHEWEVEPFKTYGRLKDLRIGSSFDYRILAPADDAGILECKNLDRMVFHEGWMEEGGQLEAPPHIELQVQHQMLVSGDDRCTIAGLVGGNTLKLIRRTADLEIHAAILDKCEKFWDSIDKMQEPEPDLPPDAAFIAKLYGYARTGTLEDMSNDAELLDLLTEYRRCAKEEKEIKLDKSTAKAKILMMIGDTEKVVANRFTVSAGMVGPSTYEVNRKEFRQFRVSERKQ